jgi:hypothetical protein
MAQPPPLLLQLLRDHGGNWRITPAPPPTCGPSPGRTPARSTRVRLSGCWAGRQPEAGATTWPTAENSAERPAIQLVTANRPDQLHQEEDAVG